MLMLQINQKQKQKTLNYKREQNLSAIPKIEHKMIAELSEQIKMRTIFL